MPLIAELAALLGKAPPGVVKAIASLVTSILGAEDPLRIAKRASAAAASEIAAENAIRRAMKARAKK